MIAFFDDDSDRFQLSEELGNGATSTVYAHATDDSLAVKVYSDPQEFQLRKIFELRAHPPVSLFEKGQPKYAWPRSIAYCAASGDPVGFSMPRIRGTIPFSGVVNPSSRLIPLNRLWLWDTATRFLKLVHTMHLHSPPVTIGDINLENFHVDRRGIVSALDVDSFSFRGSDGELYPTTVNRWEFQPPEVSGLATGRMERAQDQDAWSAYTMVWRILKEGEHPFDFKYLGAGSRPRLKEVIVNGPWPQSKRSALLQPKPSTIPFESFPFEMRELFRLMFLDGHSNRRARPNVTELLSCLLQYRPSTLPHVGPSSADWNNQLGNPAKTISHPSTSRNRPKRRRVNALTLGLVLIGASQIRNLINNGAPVDGNNPQRNKSTVHLASGSSQSRPRATRTHKTAAGEAPSRRQ